MSYRNLIGDEAFDDLFDHLTEDGVLDGYFEMEDGANFKLTIALEVTTSGKSAIGAKSGSRAYGVKWATTEHVITSEAS